MKRIFAWIPLLALLPGCVAPTITGTATFDSVEERQLLDRYCSEISAVGNARALISANQADVAGVISLLESKDPSEARDQIVVLKNRIRDRADRLARILDVRYTAESFHHSVRWMVGVEDYRKLLPFWSPWKLTAARVETSYSPRSPDELEDDSRNRELVGWTTTRVAGSTAVFALSRPASALELCQLQGAIGFRATLHFEGQHRQEFTVPVKLTLSPWSKR